MPFSPLSEAVILFCVPAVFWHLIVLGVLGRVGIARRVAIGAASLAWTAFAYANVRHGWGDVAFASLADAKPFLFMILAALLAWALADRILGEGVPQQALIAVQLFRPIGMLFVLEDARGTLPSSFAQPAGWGDLLAGLVALAVLVRYPTGPVPRRAVVLVAVGGLLDFASATFFGFTSSATPLQLFAFDAPNRVLEYPFGLIPMFLVPYAIAAHVLSLRQAARDAVAEQGVVAGRATPRPA